MGFFQETMKGGDSEKVREAEQSRGNDGGEACQHRGVINTPESGLGAAWRSEASREELFK